VIIHGFLAKKNYRRPVPVVGLSHGTKKLEITTKAIGKEEKKPFGKNVLNRRRCSRCKTIYENTEKPNKKGHWEGREETIWKKQKQNN